MLQSRFDGGVFELGVDAEPHANRTETSERVVLTHGKSELRARGEEPVWLIHPARDEVVNQDSDVRCLSTQHDGLLPLYRESSVEARDQTLSRSFLVAGRPVYLSGEVKTRDSFDL